MLNYRKHICDNHFFLPFLSAVHVCLDHSGFTVVNHFSIDLYCFLQKLVRRTIALDKSKWNKKRKGEMAEVLTEAYMSSEDSEYDESGKLLNYNVKDLAWESPKLKKRKSYWTNFTTNHKVSVPKPQKGEGQDIVHPPKTR